MDIVNASTPQIIKCHTRVKSNYTRGRACTHVRTREIGACDTRIRHVSHACYTRLPLNLLPVCTIYILHIFTVHFDLQLVDCIVSN